MDELITRISQAAGLSPEVSEQSIGEVLLFLHTEGPKEAVAQLLDTMPGGADLISRLAADTDQSGGGAMSGLFGMNEMQIVGRELFAAGREKAGEDLMGEIAGSIPGLSQFI
jgi:hypothetical protein